MYFIQNEKELAAGMNGKEEEQKETARAHVIGRARANIKSSSFYTAENKNRGRT